MSTKEQVEEAIRVLERCLTDIRRKGGIPVLATGALQTLATIARSAVPSGQVAEDQALVQRVLADPIFIRQTGPEFRATLARLAARAQEAVNLRAEAERLKAEASGNENAWRSADARADRLAADLEKAREEMEEWAARADEARRAAEEHRKRAEKAEAALAAVRAKAGDAAYAAVFAIYGDAVRARQVADAAVAVDTPGTSTHGDYGGELREEHEEPDTSADMSASKDDDPCDCDTCDEAKIDGAFPPHWTVAQYDKHQKAKRGTRPPPPSRGTVDMARSALRLPPLDIAHPCSLTCTHDDARNPGHKERVRRRSEAFKGDAETCHHNMDRRDTCGDCEYERGAEAMRAACWEAAQVWLQVHGYTDQMSAWEDLKHAIESATP